MRATTRFVVALAVAAIAACGPDKSAVTHVTHDAVLSGSATPASSDSLARAFGGGFQPGPGLSFVTHDNTLGGKGTYSDPLTVLGGGGGSGLTTVAHDTSLTGNGTAGLPLGVVDTVFQKRLSGGPCSAGAFLTDIAQTGAGTCVAETGDISAVSVTSPISGGGTTGAVTVGLTDCGPNQLYKENGAGNAWGCAADNDTTYTASTGLSLGGNAFSLATIATSRLFGNVSGSTAAPAAITGTQATTLLDAFTTTLKGLVPAPGTSTSTKYLRDDGSWAVPPDTGITGSLTSGKVPVATGPGTVTDSSISDSAGTVSTTEPISVGGATVNGKLVFGVLSPTAIGGEVDDWGPTGISTAIIVRIATSSLVDLTGIQTCTTDGRALILRNVSTNTIRIWDNDGRSTTAADEFSTKRDILSMPPGEAVGIVCSTSSSRWHVFSMSFTPTENAYKGTHLEWSNDFVSELTLLSNGAQIDPLWQVTSSGTGNLFQTDSQTLSDNRPGIVAMSTGTTTTGRNGIVTGTAAVDFSLGSWWIAATVAVPTLSNATDEYTARVGFFDTTGAANQVDGCYFQYDRGNVATSGPNSGNADKWECWCASNSARTAYLLDGTTVSDESFTTANEAVAAVTWPSTNVYRLWVVMNGSTRAEFFMDTGSGRTKVCDINTNIPSSSSRATGAQISILKSAGTASRTFNLDQATVAVDLNSARSP